MSDEELLAELKRATEGLLLMSESDYPLTLINWVGTIEVTSAYLRALTGESDTTPVTQSSIVEFFRVAVSEPEWKQPLELELAKRAQTLVRLLEENLADVKVYKVGTINLPMYVAGRIAAGTWLGVATRAVETGG